MTFAEARLMMSRRERDKNDDRYDRSWVHQGEFACDTDQSLVKCGICLGEFELPHHKADHLRMVHSAIVERHVNADGLEVYAWHLPAGPTRVKR